MIKHTHLFKTITLIWTLSQIIDIVVPDSAVENKFEHLGEGLVAHDDFNKMFKEFIDSKIRPGTRWIWENHAKKPFLENITPPQYAFLQILYALSSKQTSISDHLIEFLSNHYSNDMLRYLELSNIKDFINIPNEIMYNVSESVIIAAKIGIKPIPLELLHEIFSVMNKSAIFIRASESGNIDVMNLFLISASKSDIQLAFYNAWLQERYDIMKLLTKDNFVLEKKYVIRDRLNNCSYDNILHVAVQSRNLNLIRMLIEIGVDVNKVDDFGYSPLHKTVESNDLDTAKLLIDQGARVNSETLYGNTPLHSAAINGNKDIVELLLASGSTVDKKNKFGATPIMISEKYTVLGIIHYIFSNELIDQNNADSDLNYLNQLGFRTESDILYYEQGSDLTLLLTHSKIVKSITKRGGKLFFDEQIKTKLLSIALSNSLMILSECLFNIGAQLNPEMRETKEIFINNIQNGNKDFVLKMVTEGMPVNTILNDGTTALYVAAARGNLDILEFLIKMGGDFNAVTSDGQTLLHAAARGGDVSTFKYLVNKGLNINAKNNNGLTPLATAIQANQPEIVNALSDNDFYLSIKSSLGHSELSRAAVVGNERIVASLLKNEVDLEESTIDGYTPLLLAAHTGQTSSVKLLIDKKADIDTRRVSDGNNALHIATERGHLPVVQVLLDNNLYVDSMNRLGLTPLHLAAKYNRTEIAKFLIDHGAYVDAQEDFIQTPLHYAVGAGSLEMVNFLLSKNCKVSMVDIKGQTPLDVAAQKCDRNIMLTLLKHGGRANFNIDINCIT